MRARKEPFTHLEVRLEDAHAALSLAQTPGGHTAFQEHLISSHRGETGRAPCEQRWVGEQHLFKPPHPTPSSVIGVSRNTPREQPSCRLSHRQRYPRVGKVETSIHGTPQSTRCQGWRPCSSTRPGSHTTPTGHTRLHTERLAIVLIYTSMAVTRCRGSCGTQPHPAHLGVLRIQAFLHDLQPLHQPRVSRTQLVLGAVKTRSLADQRLRDSVRERSTTSPKPTAGQTSATE